MNGPSVLDRAIPGPGGCLLWTGYTMKNGYGSVTRRGRKFLVHRLSYEQNIGPIPEGMVIDHVKARGCRHRNCVNPAHLEAVTQKENVWRGDNDKVAIARSNVCSQGHVDDFTVLSNGGRRCRPCFNDRHRQRRQRLKAAGVKAARTPEQRARAAEQQRLRRASRRVP